MNPKPGRIPLTLRALAASLLLAPCFLPAEEPAAGRQVETERKVSDDLTVPYLLALPKEYGKDPAKKWPVILFLHGRGESNGPLSVVAKWGPPRFAARGDDFPYIVISPQCPRETNWNDPVQQEGVLAILDHTLDRYEADPARVYLTGLSMGGFGSWGLAAREPKRFAAVVPICGGGSVEDAPVLASLPIWVFHGDRDKAVPFEKSVEMVEAIRRAGGQKIRFTTLEEIGHNSWSAAYATPELYQWLDGHAIASE